MFIFSQVLKVALHILGRKFYKILKTHPYTPTAFKFSSIKPPVVENHQTREIRFTTAQVDTNGVFLHEHLAHLHTENTQTKLQT